MPSLRSKRLRFSFGCDTVKLCCRALRSRAAASGERSVFPMPATPVEPLVYSLASTVSRFSSYFYQCYIIPLALAVILLRLSTDAKPRPVRDSVVTLGVCAAAAGLYFLIAPLLGDFVKIGNVAHVALLAILILYVCFLKLRALDQHAGAHAGVFAERLESFAVSSARRGACGCVPLPSVPVGAHPDGVLALHAAHRRAFLRVPVRDTHPRRARAARRDRELRDHRRHSVRVLRGESSDLLSVLRHRPGASLPVRRAGDTGEACARSRRITAPSATS